MSDIEDRIDLWAVDRARVLATKRGEKPVLWEDFKKSLEQGKPMVGRDPVEPKFGDETRRRKERL